jgi:hypothetical protein
LPTTISCTSWLQTCALTPGLLLHQSRDIDFILILFSFFVEDLGICYNLIATLEGTYQVSLDWSFARYFRLTLGLDYTMHSTSNISMPGYMEGTLQCLQHLAPIKPEHAPHPWQCPHDGAKTQFVTPPDASTPVLDSTDKLSIHGVLGTLLFYARAIDRPRHRFHSAHCHWQACH